MRCGCFLLVIRVALFQSFSVAVLGKINMMVRLSESITFFVLDATPVMFCLGRNAHPIRHDAVYVPAIRAVDLLNLVEVFKLVSVNANVLTAPYQWESIEREADVMIDLDPEV